MRISYGVPQSRERASPFQQRCISLQSDTCCCRKSCDENIVPVELGSTFVDMMTVFLVACFQRCLPAV